MQAIAITKYGPPLEVLQLKELETPIPAQDQVLVRVHAASVNKADLAPIQGAFVARLLGTGLLKPNIQVLGTDIAGRVEAVGKAVQRFHVGDEVFGFGAGGFAEYACARADQLALKPASVPFEQAAVERRYPLAETPQAIVYLQTGHAHGKLLIDVEGGKT